MGSFMAQSVAVSATFVNPAGRPDNWIAVLRDVRVNWATPVLLLRP